MISTFTIVEVLENRLSSYENVVSRISNFLVYEKRLLVRYSLGEYRWI